MFKIAALKNIRNLFPDEWNPFYAGFGNRDTDAISYRAVGIQLERIFIINHDGEIHHFNSTYKKSYPLLAEIANEMFPNLLGINEGEEVKPKELIQMLNKDEEQKIQSAMSPKPQMGFSEQQLQKHITDLDDDMPNVEDEIDLAEINQSKEDSPSRIVFKRQNIGENSHPKEEEKLQERE